MTPRNHPTRRRSFLIPLGVTLLPALGCLYLATAQEQPVTPSTPVTPAPSVAPVPPSKPASGFHAGAAVADISPDQWPLSLRGSFTPRASATLNDPLTSRAIAVQNGSGRAVLVIVDNLMINRETLDAIKQKAAEATGWKTEEMLIAATHTHTAPSISGTGGTKAAEAYRQKAQAGIAQSVIDAIGRLQPASIAFGSDAVPDEVFNRRWYLKEGTMPLNPFGEYDKVKMNPNRADIVKPAGPTDPEVSVLDIRTRKGARPLAFLANYALHYVGDLPEGVVSADYFGEYARVMPSRVGGRKPPEDFVAVLSNGTSGDINNIDFNGTRAPRQPYEQIRLVAAKVADASWRAVRNAKRQDDLPIAILQREIELERRRPTPEALEKAKATAKLTDEEAKNLPRLAVNYAHRTIGAAEGPEKVSVLLQAIRIGDQAIVTMPFEVLVEIGLEIKKKSPFPRTFMIELANGANGYLPPPHQHELGGYETWLGTNTVQKDASVIMTRHLLEMLAELKASGS
ncbi:neutral/alkaline non-lysosomal ceramidase N-terminal domain-containing protein [Verrucomicrobium sp. BvORR106]|uniref:neutral/alkaline non-lysosomal ceramidase N-terminal domain-containing protein n=1 Tax=Verrucomicrobium sp. BvORR106 TaxID=1403819 RepID=UPI0009E044D4|nr:neutral/alkaline non-lysosomal ceramidase N-terminal domain-containing protein [Verrucomicrobium sp. BvORR106]